MNLIRLVRNEIYKLFKQKKMYVFMGIAIALVFVRYLSLQITNSSFENGQSFPLAVLKMLYSFGVIYVTVLVSQMLISEYKSGIIKMTLVCPISRIKLLGSKVIALFVGIVFIQLFTLLVSYIVGTIFLGWGYSYTFHGTKLTLDGDWISVSQSFKGISGILFMIKTYLLATFSFLSIGVSVFFFSIAFLSTGPTIITSLGIWLILPPILQSIRQIRPILLDSYYYFVSAFLQKIDISQVIMGFTIIILYGFVFFAAGAYLLKEKDILI